MIDRALSRRSFLKTATVAALGVGLAACQPIPPLADDEAALGEVTAAQVTDPESLKAFVLGAKARIEAITDMNVGASLREDLKTEGYWKSGSTFLIIFLKTGEPFIHGNDREAESKNLLYVEDERGTMVVQELFAAAAQGGGFVEYYDDGPKTAYAVEYTSGITGRQFVLVGGYSQDVSHVEIEIADLPKPPVTASEVVDRETLISFVEAAAEAYRTAVMSEGYSALTGVRNAFRVEGGDWKAGSIYLYVVSGGGVTLFHGSEPFREGKRTDMTRTDSKGVRFAELLIGVARREGKSFLRYHYDNPAIEGDEETGSPKLGYAVSFPVPNSEQRAVVGSGIYIDEDEE
ncbi:MAG: twin-arginine translocation signal domain-containing protein [Caldilineaceae bacterium SB0670_bin_27]|nr:twin-arginine translocation signal domain-containing protein [Caldilineaceae bacterium SB0670_bin_27]